MAAARPNPRPASFALVDARIVTMDDARPEVPALAVRGDRIVTAGSEEMARSVVDGDGPVIDLGGRTVTPGLIDGHAHLDREGLRDRWPSLAGARSIEDIVERIRGLAAVTPPGAWITTMPIGTPPYYFDPPATLAEGRWPTAADLDRATTAHPVYIRGIWGYWDRPPITSIANSMALARAGIGRTTLPPCDSVEIERDADGDPTGVFRERDPLPILELTLFRDAPRFSAADRLEGLRIGQARYHATGTTGVYEGHGCSPDVLAAFRDLHEQGDLTMRARLPISPTWSSVDEARTAIRTWLTPMAGRRGTGDDVLRQVGVFLGIGHRSCVAETYHAALPYTAWAGFSEWEHDPEEFAAIAEAAADAGLRINTLANDERILDTALDILEPIAARTTLRTRRPVFEHLRAASPAAIGRLRDLGAIVTTQPAGYLWKAGSTILDTDRDPNEFVAHRTLDELGVPFALTTDNKPASSLWALWAAVAREERRTGRVVGAAQRLDVRRALRALTVDAARLSFEEDERGVIMPGALADLVVFEDDPEAVPVDALRELPVCATLVGGRVVHAAAGGPFEVAP